MDDQRTLQPITSTYRQTMHQFCLSWDTEFYMHFSPCDPYL